MKKILNSVITFGMVAALPMMAKADFDQQGAMALKEQLKNSYTWKSVEMNQKSGTINLEGDIEVIPMGEYYSVKYPNISYDTGEIKLDLGVPEINMIPDGDDAWKFTAKIPSPMKIYNTKDVQIGQIEIGEQLSQGIWNVKTGISPLVKAVYSDIKLSLVDTSTNGKVNSVNATIDKLTYNLKLEKNSDNSWSGPSLFVMDDLKGNFSNNYMMSVDQIKSYTNYDGLNMANSVEMIQDLGDLAEKQTSGQSNSEDVMKMSSSAFNMLKNIVKNMQSQFVVSGVELKTNQMPSKMQMGNNPIVVNIDSIDAEYNVNGMDTNNTEVTVIDSIKGLNVSGLPELYNAIIPENINLSAKVSRLPMQDLITALEGDFGNLMKSAEGNNNPNKEKLSISIPKLLSEYGTNLVITDSYLNADTLKIGMSGDIKADSSAKNNAYGQFSAVFNGITETLSLISNASTEDVNPQMAQQMKIGLSMLQGMGKTNQNGSVIYKFEMTKDGQFLMNGDPLGGLIGGLPR